MKPLPPAAVRAALALSLCSLGACREPKPAPAAPPDLASYLALGPLDGPPDPVATKLCAAFITMPEERRARCCPPLQLKNSPTAAAAECTRYLSASIRDKAIVLDAAAVDRCVAAMTTLYTGCDWISPSPQPLPETCENLLKGARPSSSPCRSSLECEGSLRCQGLSLDKPGTCAGPLDNGTSCAGIASDVLAASLRKDDLDDRHPECEGHCERKRCAAPISPDGPCEKSAQCDSQHHCVHGRCRAGAFAKLGEECTGRCAPRLRCAASHCEQAPHGPAACNEKPAP